MTGRQRRRVATTAAALLLLAAGLLALALTAGRPGLDRVSSTAGHHHVTLPSPLRNSVTAHEQSGDAALLAPVALAAAALLFIGARLRTPAALPVRPGSARVARAPPRRG